MPDLLLELFSEEIPARLQRRAASDLERLVCEALKTEGLKWEGAKAFSTPRRLALVVTGLPPAQADLREERKGPRVGAPDKAVEGFLKSAGLSSLEDAQIHEDKKGQFYVAVVERTGRPTAEVLAGLIPEVIAKLPWPKSMRWGETEMRWVRPLHSILCTFDAEVVPFAIDTGAGQILSGGRTFGHRFHAPDEIQIRNFEAYEAELRRAKVILDPDEREEIILGEAKALAKAQGLELLEDKGLLAEVAGLAEWPVPRIGSFAEKFLTVPDEALIASMKGHQKYFSVIDPSTGRLAPKFITVANIEPTDGGEAMMVGYERVLEARLSDAWFLYHQDLKKPLADHAGKLEDVTFFEGLGTTAEKVERVARLAKEIAPMVGADPHLAEKAARLSKADLPTEMVGEFPELQGIMGRYYALEEGVELEIADAIRDHYKPAGQNDEVPSAPVSIAVALADKLVTLAMFWSIGKKPTGSGDPFALRRMALGVIQIVLARKVRLQPLSLFDLVSKGIVVEGNKSSADNDVLDAVKVEADKVWSDLLAFFHDRLSVYLKDQGFRHDYIKAVLAPDADDFVLIVKKLEALKIFMSTDDGENLTAAYKRAGNILKAEAKKGDLPTGTVDQPVLSAAEEKELFTQLCAVQSGLVDAVDQENFEGAMALLAKLRVPLDAFFEEVTVNADDPKLRANRLLLLNNIIETCDRVACFSELEG